MKKIILTLYVLSSIVLAQPNLGQRLITLEQNFIRDIVAAQKLLKPCVDDAKQHFTDTQERPKVQKCIEAGEAYYHTHEVENQKQVAALVKQLESGKQRRHFLSPEEIKTYNQLEAKRRAKAQDYWQDLSFLKEYRDAEHDSAQ